jgi:hypothetical protein
MLAQLYNSTFSFSISIWIKNNCYKAKILNTLGSNEKNKEGSEGNAPLIIGPKRKQQWITVWEIYFELLKVGSSFEETTPWP